MAASVLYTNFGGATVHEHRHADHLGSEGEERFYISDTLGSTAKMTDHLGNVTDSMEFWPYGEVFFRTGSSLTPFTWVGAFGYYQDAARKFYVRMRSYLADVGSWMTVDPIGSWAKYYQPSRRPNTLVDPSGLLPGINFLGLLKDCGMSILGSASAMIANWNFGTTRGQMKPLLCSISGSCLAAIFSAVGAAIFTTYFPGFGSVLGACLGGLIGGILSSLITSLYCKVETCDPEQNKVCTLLNSFYSGLGGCVSQILGGQGQQWIDVIVGNLLNFFFGEIAYGCENNGFLGNLSHCEGC